MQLRLCFITLHFILWEFSFLCRNVTIIKATRILNRYLNKLSGATLATIFVNSLIENVRLYCMRELISNIEMTFIILLDEQLMWREWKKIQLSLYSTLMKRTLHLHPIWNSVFAHAHYNHDVSTKRSSWMHHFYSLNMRYIFLVIFAGKCLCTCLLSTNFAFPHISVRWENMGEKSVELTSVVHQRDNVFICMEKVCAMCTYD